LEGLMLKLTLQYFGTISVGYLDFPAS